MKTTDQHTAYLGLGSNLGSREANLALAIEEIGTTLGEVTMVSRIYSSRPEGFDSPNLFLNLCLEMQTSMSPSALLDALIRIETAMGRTREGKGYADRIIDLDILLYDDLVLEPGDLVAEAGELVLPHPEMADRHFVLKPMAEIAPELKHPVSGLDIAGMLLELTRREPGKAKEVMPVPS